MAMLWKAAILEIILFTSETQDSEKGDWHWGWRWWGWLGQDDGCDGGQDDDLDGGQDDHLDDGQNDGYDDGTIGMINL